MTLNKIKSSKFAIKISIIFVSILLAYIISTLPVVDNLQHKSIDSLFNLRGPMSPPDTSIVIVAIDDMTMESMPIKYPYPTSFYAKLVNNLVKAEVKLIVFDIEFIEENTKDPEFDLFFARAVTDARNVVLAGKIVYEVGSSSTQNTYVVKPIAPLLRSLANWGLVNILEDEDGFLRRYLLFQTVNKKNYYPLAIEAIKTLENTEPSQEQDPYSPTFLVGDKIIPKVTPNSMLINYRGPAQTFRTYSLASVLDDSTFSLKADEDTDIFDLHLEWGTFKDKIVFVGATAAELQDNKYTPFFNYGGQKQKIPGVEMHANALSTIIKGDFIKNLDKNLNILFTLLLVVLALFFTLRLRPWVALLAISLEIIFMFGLIYILFSHYNIVCTTTTPSFGIMFSFIIGLVYQAFIERREKNRIRKTFQQYVSPAVVEKMLSTGEVPSYGGERRTLTILFSDIRKFTSFSESHEPEEVVSRLSEYLTEMVDVIFKQSGTLDKFVGDEIMALFGAPYFFDDHAERACITALQMQAKLKELREKWASQNGKDSFNVGIGINTGKVIVGNLGSSQLFDYTVIGDHVNIGARLESANKEYQTTIILSESTYELVKRRAKVRELDFVRVVGKSHPIRIFELLGMDSIQQNEQDYLIDVYSEGLNAYRERRWSEALVKFRKVLRYYPTDGPSKVYTVRCLDFVENSPPVNWDGVYDFKTK